MWRTFFLAIGISLCILGCECLVVEKAVLALPVKKQVESRTFYGTSKVSAADNTREVVLPEWAPWILLSTGAIVSIYSITLRRQG